MFKVLGWLFLSVILGAMVGGLLGFPVGTLVAFVIGVLIGWFKMGPALIEWMDSKYE